MYLQARRAAALLDLPISSFYQLVRAGQLPPAVSKVGKHQLWRQDDLIATVDPHRYNRGHGHAETTNGHSPAGQGQRARPVLLAPGPGNSGGRPPRAPPRRSPFFGVLGGVGEGAGGDPDGG